MNRKDPRFRNVMSIVRRLADEGYTAWIVGGAVRNWLLNLPPKDYDIATSARPDVVADLFPGSNLVGAKFGVVLVGKGDDTVEVATFRSDGRYIDHRHPENVTYSSPEQDARRRDFTINALFYDPIEDRVIDYVDGRKDLEAKCLRAIGDPHKRFDEDALRMLRAVRFSRRFDLAIEPETSAAIRENADFLDEISAERIRDELVLLFTGLEPGCALRDLEDFGLLKVVLPEVADLRGVRQGKTFHPEGDALDHVVRCLEMLPDNPSPTLAIGTLLHDIGKAPTITEDGGSLAFPKHENVGAVMVDKVCRRLRFSNADRQRIVELTKNHMKFMHVLDMKESTLRRFLAEPYFEELLELHKADVLGSNGRLDFVDFLRNKQEELAREGKERPPKPWIDGDDLIAAGLRPGPQFRDILEELYDMQLEGVINDRDQAVEELRQIINERQKEC